MKKILLLALLFAFCFQLNAQDFTAAKSLIERRTPWLNGKVQFTKIDKTKDGKDVFTIETKNKIILIGASSTSASTKGLGYYLKMYCHRSLSHMGDNLTKPKTIPDIPIKETIISDFDIRYALNYCTISYSMAFYSWEQWEHELDWMALQGVNLMLAPVGTETIWQKTLQKFDISNEGIDAFLPGPAFTAWWLMGNMEGWGGPISQTIIDRQKNLEIKILNRMRSLGIQPVLQSFYGMVPASLKTKYKDWNIVSQGNWAGDFRRPDILLPTDPHFKEMASVYYKTIKETYGNDIRFFAGEPFHEGGITTGIDVPNCASIVQQTMLENIQGSTWILQGWQNNPTDRLLAKLDKKHVIIQELFGENTENWLQRKGYNGTPFIWCTVTNFGEKQGLYGKLQRFSDEINKAKNSAYKNEMRGIGVMPEGIINNPVVYDYVLDLGWSQKNLQASDWIKNYVTARYGTTNKNIEDAWQIFLQTVYSSPKELQEGPEESVFCARPSLEVGSVSTWGTRKRNYDTALFAQGVEKFLAETTNITSSTYQTDAVDFARQLLANKGESLYRNMVNAFEKKDPVLFKKTSSIFLESILLQDSLLSFNPHFQLHTWLKSAVDCANNEKDKNLLLYNSKAQISFWGPDNNRQTDLHEYAHKEWNGMMRYFYYPRWKMFVDNCMGNLRNKHLPEPDYYSFEMNWAKEKSLYPRNKLNKLSFNSIVKRIYKM